MRKNFVLDTNVLLHDPRAMFHFADNDVVIPIYVLEEIDHFKKELSERGRNAREVARRLDEFRNHGHSLSEGVALENGGACMVALASRAAARRAEGVAVAGQQHPRRGARGARHGPTIVRRSWSPRTSTCASAPTRSA